MKRFSWLSTVCALGLGSAAMLGAARASAQECVSDADCSGGLVCTSYGVQEDCARPAIACAEGEECPEPAPCEAKEVKGCALPSCETDDDCPGGTACYAATYERCSGGTGADPGAAPAPCPDGEECPQPEEPEEPVCDTPECKEAIVPVDCETVTEAPVCVPVHQLPCSQDADCGAGFTCEEQISMSCSGSAGSPTPSSGGGSDGDPGSSDPLPPEEQQPSEPSCTSERTGEFYCKVIVTECASSDECEAGWTCEENPSRPVCDGAAGERPAGNGDDSGAFAPPADGDTPDGDQPVDSDCGVESTEPEMVCLPPFHDVSVGRDARADGETASGTPGSDNDSGGEPPTMDPLSGDDNEEGDGDEASGMGESDSTSCAVATPGSGAGSSAMSLLGLIGLATLLRRRARKV